MSDGVKQYVLLSSTMLLIVLAGILAWVFYESRICIVVFTYIVGLLNGMLVIAVNNMEED